MHNIYGFVKEYCYPLPKERIQYGQITEAPLRSPAWAIQASGLTSNAQTLSLARIKGLPFRDGPAPDRLPESLLPACIWFGFLFPISLQKIW